MINEELYIDNQLADIAPNSISISYVSPFFNMKGLSNSTYSIKLLDTDNNKKIIKHLNEPDMNTDFPYKYHYADYIKDGELIIDKGEVKVLGDFEIQITFGLNKSKYDILKSDKLNETPITGLESDWLVNWKKSNVVYSTGKKFKFIDYTSGKRVSELQMDGSVVISKAIPQEPILSNMKPMTMHPFIPHSSVLSLFNAKVSGLTDYKKTKYNIIGNPNPYRLTINGIAHNIKIGSNIYSLFGIDTHVLGYTVVSIVDSSTIQLNIPITLHPENEQTIEVDANTFNSLLTRRLNEGIILNGNKANEKTYSFTQSNYISDSLIRNGFYFTPDSNPDSDGIMYFKQWGGLMELPLFSLAANVSQTIYPVTMVINLNNIALRSSTKINLVRRKSAAPYEPIETIEIPATSTTYDSIGILGRYNVIKTIEITEEMKDDVFSIEFDIYERYSGAMWGSRPWIANDEYRHATITVTTKNSFYYITDGSDYGIGRFDCIANLPDCTYMEYLQQLAIMSGGFISNDLDKDIRIYYLDEIKSNLAAKNVYDWSGKIQIDSAGEYKFNSLAKKNYIKFNNSKDLTDRDTIIEIADDTIDVEKTLETLIFDSPLGDVDTKSEYILYEQDIKEVTGDSANKTFLTETTVDDFETPDVPYKKGDIWIENDTVNSRFKTRVATTTKTSSESYSSDDWIEYYDSKSITDLASDGVLTPSEKANLYREWEAISNEKDEILAEATNAGINSGYDEWTEYVAAYNALNTYLFNVTNGILLHLDVQSDVDPDELKTAFNTYYIKRVLLKKAISGKINSTATNALNNVSTLNTKINDWASDGKLSPIEKQQLYREWQIIIQEKSKLEIAAGYYSVSTSAYISAYNALDYYLNTNPNVLANLETTTTIVKNDFIAVFTNYTSAKEALNNAIALAAKNFVGTSINNIAIGGRNLFSNGDFYYGVTDWGVSGSYLATKNVYAAALAYLEHGASGLSTLYSGDLDDSYIEIPLPTGFEVYFNKTKYTSVYVSSNSFISYGVGSGAYPYPSYPSILISSADRRMRYLYGGALDSNRYLVRYVGYSAYAGQPSGNTIIWEATFYKHSSVVDIQIISNTTVSPQRGVGGLWNGSSFLYQNDSLFLGNIGTAFKINSEKYPNDINSALIIKTSAAYNGLYRTYNLDLGSDYVLSFWIRLMDGDITFYCGYQDDVRTLSLTGSDWQRVIIKFNPATQANFVFFPTTASTFLISNIQLEKGNIVTNYSMTYEDLQSKILELEFLKTAYAATTDIDGGVIATTLIRMRDEYGVYNGGFSGLASDNVGFWTGGTYSQAIAQLANTILNKDGSGQFAGGKIIWDILGRLGVGNFKIEDGQIVGYSSGKDKIRIKNSSIADIASLASTYVKDSTEYNLSDSYSYDNSASSEIYSGTHTFQQSGTLTIATTTTNVRFVGNINVVFTGLTNIISISADPDYFEVYSGGTLIYTKYSGETLALSAGTYSILHKTPINFEVAKNRVGSFNVVSSAYIEVEQGTERSEIGSNGIYSYFGDTEHFYFKQGFGLQARQGDYGIRLKSTGLEKMTDGINWVSI